MNGGFLLQVREIGLVAPHSRACAGEAGGAGGPGLCFVRIGLRRRQLGCSRSWIPGGGLQFLRLALNFPEGPVYRLRIRMDYPGNVVVCYVRQY